MAKQQTQRAARSKSEQPKTSSNSRSHNFHLEFLNQAQKMAWGAIEKHDVIFLLGCAGTGKTHLATSFAISEILAKRKRKIVLTRPIVEAGESLGFLPGDFSAKVDPYMAPMYDCMDAVIGEEGPQRDFINKCCVVSPLAYLRGKTFNDSICIFDEAQNATLTQLKLFLTRIGKNSKIIITGDPYQSDIPKHKASLMDVVDKLEGVQGIGVIRFKPNAIVRHPLIGSILEKLEESEDN